MCMSVAMLQLICKEGKFYKVVVTQKDGTDVTVVLNEKGEEVK